MIDRPAVCIQPAVPTVAQPVDDPAFPSQFSVWSGGALSLAGSATHYGYVQSGEATIEFIGGGFRIRSGMYFSVPGALAIHGDGRGFVASRLGYHGFFQIGGPVETYGRLTYIDGCSDSLIIPPVVMGDPCLNLLYLPPGTRQTGHTHPSCRLGMIVEGSGRCLTRDATYRLAAGMTFEIAADAWHSFHTDDEPLRVIAWHPDSDCGPTNQDHPMINRTLIDGVSARDRLKMVGDASL